VAQQAISINRKSVAQTEKRGLAATLWKHRHPYLFISPFYLLFAIFGLFPMVFSMILSLTEWKGVGEIKFIGLRNFERMMTDQVFWQSFGNGVTLFLLYVPIMLLLALFLAVLLNLPTVRGFRIFRTIIFMPFITNMVAAGFAFQILLTNNNGLFNVMLSSVGLPTVPWLETTWGARISLSLLIIWAWLGYNMVLMHAGLQTIPQDLKEAARVDGANQLQTFFYITIPLMRPVLLFCTVMSTMGSFGLFAEVRTLTGGGPMNATITPLLKIYGNAFNQFQFGYASALAYTYFAIIFMLTLFQVRILGRETQ
jgi:lactose/L-arabinose transport system permease protein